MFTRVLKHYITYVKLHYITMVFCNLQNLEWITIIVLSSLAAGRRSALTSQHEDKKLAAHVKFSMNNQEDHSPVMAPF